MPGAPPKGREGWPATLSGVPIYAGIMHPSRHFSARAAAEDLWTDLVLAMTPARLAKLNWSATPSPEISGRFVSYITQARSFYFAAASIDARSRPLPAYYSLLNLAKAWLTLVDATVTAGKVTHGASDSFQAAGTYSFAQEKFRFHTAGVLAEIAKRTGVKHVLTGGTDTPIEPLLPTLCEGLDYVSTAAPGSASLIPLRDLRVRQGYLTPDDGTTGCLWLLAYLDRGSITPAELLPRAPAFASVFDHITTDVPDCYAFESRTAHQYGVNPAPKVPSVLADVSTALIFIDRTSARRRYFALASSNSRELSQEARTFAVLHHLSNMVRYRPECVDLMAAGEWSWLLSTWVPRALENAVLGYSARILGREAFIE